MRKYAIFVSILILSLFLTSCISTIQNIPIKDKEKDFSKFPQMKLSELFSPLELNESVRVKGKIVHGSQLKFNYCKDKLYIKDDQYHVVLFDNEGNYFDDISYIGREVEIIVDNRINLLTCDAEMCECELHISFKDIKMIK